MAPGLAGEPRPSQGRWVRVLLPHLSMGVCSCRKASRPLDSRTSWGGGRRAWTASRPLCSLHAQGTENPSGGSGAEQSGRGLDTVGNDECSCRRVILGKAPECGSSAADEAVGRDLDDRTKPAQRLLEAVSGPHLECACLAPA